MPAVLVALTVVPLFGAVLSLLPGRWIAPAASVTAGVACLGLPVTLVPAAANGPVVLGFLRADAISVVSSWARRFFMRRPLCTPSGTCAASVSGWISPATRGYFGWG